MDWFTNFEFSQSSLQDYAECRRRFQLRYIQRVAWPAVQAEPIRENELHMQRGNRFHRLAQQYLIGIPEDSLTRMAQADRDAHLMVWWQNFLACIPADLPGTRYVEATLQTQLGSHRLVAKYDLILVCPDGSVRIYDWKTSMRRPARETLQKRLQTRVYLFLLAQAGGALGAREVIPGSCAVDPQRITMQYWFAEPGQPPETILYSSEQLAADQQYLTTLLDEVHSLPGADFGMVEDEKGCAFCVYRSLCDRGAVGRLEDRADVDLTDDSLGDFLMDLDQMGEIRF